VTIEQLTDRNSLDTLEKLSDHDLNTHLAQYFKVTRPEMADKPKKAQKEGRSYKKHKKQARSRNIMNKAEEVMAEVARKIEAMEGGNDR
jgi:hypothetical protein